MCVLKVRLKGHISRIFHLDPSFYFMTKSSNFLSFFKYKFLHFMNKV